MTEPLAIPEPPPVSRPGRRFRKVLIAMCAILGLFGANQLYVRAAGRWLGSPDLSVRLNRHPDRFRISWRDARSPFPGWLIVHDLELAGRTRRSRWSLHADEVQGALSLPSLTRRRLAFHDLVASGVAIRVARILPPGAVPIDGQAAIVPAFPQSPEEFEATLKAVPKRPRWTIDLSSVSLDRIRELWLERWRLAGSMKAHGGMRLHLGRDAEVLMTRLDLLDAGLTVVGRPAGSHLHGSVTAFTSPYSPRRERGWQAVRHVSGELRLEGRLHSLEFLLGLMPRLPWLAIEGGEGSFRARLLLAKGKLGRGSAAEIAVRKAIVDFLDYQARGEAALSWRIDRDRMSGQADLSHCEIRRQGASAPYARAPALRLSFTSKDLQMDGRLDDYSGVADLPRAEVPDLRYYNAYLPTGSGLALTGGRGVLKTRVTIDSSGRMAGRILLSASDVAATARGLALRGRCGVTVALASQDLKSRRFTLGGSRARCEGVEIRDSEPPGSEPSSRDWWAIGTVGDGVVAPGAEHFLSLGAKVEARDAMPIFALFGDRPGAKLVAHFFRGKGVAATGRVDLSSAAWTASGVGFAGPRLTAEARLSGRKGQIEGALLAGIGRRQVGIELAGHDRKLHLRGAEDWFAGADSSRPRVRKRPL
ncbi:MAG: hypothetical protein ABJC13_21705 [Acidobacteriota bacterium]